MEGCTKEDIERAVVDAAARTYGKDAAALSRDTSIRGELGARSLQLVGMISLINDEFDVMVGNREAMAAATLGDIVDLVAEQVEEG